jgi:hypothetical protein
MKTSNAHSLAPPTGQRASTSMSQAATRKNIAATIWQIERFKRELSGKGLTIPPVVEHFLRTRRQPGHKEGSRVRHITPARHSDEQLQGFIVALRVNRVSIPPVVAKLLSIGRQAAPRKAAAGLSNSRVGYKRVTWSDLAPNLKKNSGDSESAEGRAEPALDDGAFALGPRAKAILRGIEIAREDLLSSGGSFTLEQVRKLLHGVSRQSVEKRVREGSLLAVQGRSNKRYYPALQFKDDGSVVEGLSALQDALPTKNGYAILNFLVNPDPRISNRKPIDLLKEGKVEIVVEAAQRIGEQGA